MMALIMDDKGTIHAQHPVTLSQIIRFIGDNKPGKTEDILDPLYEDTDVISESVLDRVQGDEDLEAALENVVTDWAAKNPDGYIQNLDPIEAMYNAIRLTTAHRISASNYGANNPDSVNSLTDISRAADTKVHIRLVPVAGRTG